MKRAEFVKQQVMAREDMLVRELSTNCATFVDAWKDGAFGFSLRAFLLYAQCGNRMLRTSGLVIMHHGAVFALGLFEREDGLHAHIISPRGDASCEVVASFSWWLLSRCHVDNVYVRHLIGRDVEQLYDNGFQTIDWRPWLPEAPSEDETYNHRLVYVPRIMSISENGFSINSLPELESRNCRRKFRLAHSRFLNFLHAHDLAFELLPMQPSDYSIAKSIVRAHFERLELAEKAIGSTAQDYDQLLRNPLPDNEQYLSLMGWICSKHERVPVSVFLGERTGIAAGALYLTITCRDNGILPSIGVEDDTGFSAISQYTFARVFEAAYRRGWENIDLGGSETEDLDRFKRQMGASFHPSQWAVLTRMAVSEDTTDHYLVDMASESAGESVFGLRTPKLVACPHQA